MLCLKFVMVWLGFALLQIQFPHIWKQIWSLLINSHGMCSLYLNLFLHHTTQNVELRGRGLFLYPPIVFSVTSQQGALLYCLWLFNCKGKVSERKLDKCYFLNLLYTFKYFLKLRSFEILILISSTVPLPAGRAVKLSSWK